jgi:DNA-directed RNA polymerase specialized sigma24 family protein
MDASLLRPAAARRRRRPSWRDVKEASAAGSDVARDAFGDLVDLLQRRAVRLAYVYLRNAGNADDVVQDAFVKAFTRIGDYRTEQPFDPGS